MEIGLMAKLREGCMRPPTKDNSDGKKKYDERRAQAKGATKR